MTLAELRPFGDRLLVRPDPKLQTTEGGLHIPDVVLADNPNYFTMTGVVLKLGDGIREDVYRCQNRQCGSESRRTVGERCPICGATQVLRQAEDRRPFDCAVGDRVLFNRFAGKQIDVANTGICTRCQPSDNDQSWCPDCGGKGRNPRFKVLMLREVEVLGIVDGAHRVVPGYQAPTWNKATSNTGDTRAGKRAS